MDIKTETALRIHENLATAVLLFDKDLHLLSINSAGEGLLSISNKQALGMTPKQIWPISPFFHKAIKRSLHSASTCIQRGVDMYLSKHRNIKVDCMITTVLEGEVTEEILVELADENEFERVMKEVKKKNIMEEEKEEVKGMENEIKNKIGGISGEDELLEMEMENEELYE